MESLGDIDAAAVYQRRVYTFALYFLGHSQEAEDVTQEVLFRYWRHGGALESSALLPWLLRVTRNACYDLLRRRRQPLESVSLLEPSAAERVVDHAPDPEALAVSSALQQRVRGALRELPEPYRSAVILREIQGLSYQEISDSLDIPLNTVRVHIHRGRQKLRELLLEEAPCRVSQTV